jgi:hypothetical protein
MFRSSLIVMLVLVLFPLGVCHGEENSSERTRNIVLTPADQLILDAIGKVNERIDKMGQGLNGRIDKVNERIDNLWITMLGGFLGVMAFIGALVFWDRRTFLKRAREEFRNEVSEDRKKMEGVVAALKKLGEKFPEVQEVLRSFGLL